MDRIDPEQLKGARKLFDDFLKDESGSVKPRPREKSKGLLHAAVVSAAMAGGIMSMSGKKEDPRPAGIEMQDKQQLSELIRELEQGATPIHNFEAKDFPEGERPSERKELLEDELQCLTRNTYHEARGESEQGQYAVMFATLGRVLDKRYPKSICGVVHQRMQFSWTADNTLLAQPINMREYLKVAINVHNLMQGRDIAAAAVEAGLRAGLPQGAIFYKVRDFTGSPRVEKFFAQLQLVASIDNHDFYIKKEPPKKAARAAKVARAKTAP
ncbi:MAG: cell wall hydrolase [bacterium]|nr:cell wall hydrolase [bacterium]